MLVARATGLLLFAVVIAVCASPIEADGGGSWYSGMSFQKLLPFPFPFAAVWFVPHLAHWRNSHFIPPWLHSWTPTANYNGVADVAVATSSDVYDQGPTAAWPEASISVQSSLDSVRRQRTSSQSSRVRAQQLGDPHFPPFINVIGRDVIKAGIIHCRWASNYVEDDTYVSCMYAAEEVFRLCVYNSENSVCVCGGG